LEIVFKSISVQDLRLAVRFDLTFAVCPSLQITRCGR